MTTSDDDGASMRRLSSAYRLTTSFWINGYVRSAYISQTTLSFRLVFAKSAKQDVCHDSFFLFLIFPFLFRRFLSCKFISAVKKKKTLLYSLCVIGNKIFLFLVRRKKVSHILTFLTERVPLKKKKVQFLNFYSFSSPENSRNSIYYRMTWKMKFSFPCYLTNNATPEPPSSNDAI